VVRAADVERVGARPQILAFAAGFLVASLLALALGLAAGEDAAPSPARTRLSKPAADPVLVVVVGDQARVDLVRKAVDRERIIFDTAHAFALRERRIIAAAFEQVGPMLMQAGWRDDPLEIVASRSASTRSEAAADHRASKIAELMNKPTLNILEARMALDLL
jgi:hypothetical protein